MLKLGVNIDHVATLRQARYREAGAAHPLAEPSPLRAALASIEAGAHSITAHLREDRRHIQDHDIFELKKNLSAPLNLEMAVTDAMVDFALHLAPADVCLVPENRREVTTEGGLDVKKNQAGINKAIRALCRAGITVSLFIDPDLEQIQSAVDCEARCIELHTGAYANALTPVEIQRELEQLRSASMAAHKSGLQVNAGHGLNYSNIRAFLATPHLDTLNIGHSIVSRAVITGMNRAVHDMLALINKPAT